MYKNKKDIKKRLKVHLEKSGKKGEYFGIFLKGSQNYMKEFNVNSDVDSVVIYVPNLIETINTTCTKKETIKLECGEEIAFLDIRSFFKEIDSPTLFTIEALQTEYFILNEKYKEEFLKLKKMLKFIVNSNKKTLIENICKVNERNMKHINKYGLCEKKAFHLIRMSNSAVKIKLGKKADECLKSIPDFNVRRIKYNKSIDPILLKEMCVYYYQNSKTLESIAEDILEKKKQTKKIADEILFSILKGNFSPL